MSELITQISGEFSGGEIDPMLEAIRQAVISSTTGVLAEIGEQQICIVAPEETDAGIEAMIKTAMGKTKGLAVLMIPADGKNPDPEAPGPLCNVGLQVHIYVSTRIRGKNAEPPMKFLTALSRFLHHAKVSLNAWDHYEQVKFTGYAHLPDPDFTAFSVDFERELQF